MCQRPVIYGRIVASAIILTHLLARDLVGAVRMLLAVCGFVVQMAFSVD
jgi:hypothetical protein